MSRVCELTGKGRQVGNNVSHANNKTKRTFLPNLQNVTLISDALGQSVKLRVSTHGLRSVEHVGGLDNWLLKTSDDKLSTKVRKLKRAIAKKSAEQTALINQLKFQRKIPERRLHRAFSLRRPRITAIDPASTGFSPFPRLVWKQTNSLASRNEGASAREVARGQFFMPRGAG